MSLFQLCEGVECLKVNDFGLPRDKGSFRPGSKVCDRCEDAADREAGVRPVRVPVPAPAAPPRAVETKAPALDRVPCKRCGVPMPPEELNKDGGCKPCKRLANQAQRERRVARRKQASETSGAPAAKVDPPPVAPPPPRLMEAVDVDPVPESAPAPSPAAWVAEREQLVCELRDMEIKLGRAGDALRDMQARELEHKRKITTLEHALTASRVMYEALELRFSRHAEAHQR